MNDIKPFRLYKGAVYFAGSDTAHGSELWKTDGTPAGTVRVTDLNPGAGSANPGNFTVMGTTLYMAASGGAGATLWRSDGTSAGDVDG